MLLQLRLFAPTAHVITARCHCCLSGGRALQVDRGPVIPFENVVAVLLQKAGGPAPVKQVQLRGSDSGGDWENLNNLWGAVSTYGILFPAQYWWAR
jgi:hypothetical protein